MRLAFVVLLGACGRVRFDPLADGNANAMKDGMTNCTLQPFSTPTPVSALNSAADESDVTLAPDGLTIFFTRSADIYAATRPNKTAGFGVPHVVSDLQSAGNEARLNLSSNGTSVYFERDGMIWYAIHGGGETFTGAMVLPALTGIAPALTSDGTELFFSSPFNVGGRDLYHTTLTTPTTFSPIAAVTELNTPDYDAYSTLSADGLTIIYEHGIAGVDGDLMIASRPTRSAAFGISAVIPEVSTAAVEGDPWLSLDETELFFVRDDGGSNGADVFVATRTCL